MRIHAVAGLTILTLLAACGDSPAAPGVPDFEGEIVSVSRSTDNIVHAVVDTDLGQGSDIRILSVKPGVRISARRYDGSPFPLEGRRLAAGVRIRVGTTGIELRSLPPQYEATWVEIVVPKFEAVD